MSSHHVDLFLGSKL